MMKFFYAPNTCSIGIHVMLEEIGAPYESIKVDFRAKEQFSERFRSVNPKGKVPTLVRDDGSVLTEFQAMAFWLGRAFPAAGLLAEDLEAQTRALELLDFMVATVHMRGFTFVLVPMKFTPTEAAQQELTAHGREVIAAGFDRLAGILGEKEWLMGGYSIADPTLFYLTAWARLKDVPMPDALAAFHDRMLARPAVQRALKIVG